MSRQDAKHRPNRSACFFFTDGERVARSTGCPIGMQLTPCTRPCSDLSKRSHQMACPRCKATMKVEFRTAEGEALAISIPRSEAHVIRHFQERMPYGLFVPEVPSE